MILGPLTAVHAAATFVMVGVIWFVQVVHYPLFAAVGRAEFAAWQAANLRRTTWVVAPAMAIEALAAGALTLLRGDALAWLGGTLLAVVWLSTALVQVPCHGRLERSFDAAAARRLVRSNWLRTGAWSARGAVALELLSG
ncbi:MAG: hypothetical protein IPM29_07100 [Planctomycetes bacterium]|nr:hypothetical protein [Planctomycetota bacterium]